MKTHGLAQIHMKRLSNFVSCLPLGGFCVAVIWSLYFDFDASTRTHCRVANYLPSVSAAIGLTPQAYIWRLCIGLHITPRYFALMLFKDCYANCEVNHEKLLAPLYKVLVFLSLLGYFIELSGLLGLSVISSTESKDIHEHCFIAFMVGALVCMIASCLVCSITIKTSPEERIIAKRKFQMCSLTVCSCALAVYFYWRHNAYCEPGVYTLFALCEYVIILSNIYFHRVEMRMVDSFRLTVVDIEVPKLG